jgi:2,5-diketo-D-gluconate reductase B
MQHIANAQGLNMPKLGLGTWPMLGDECTRAVEQALGLGYRHIDTAAAYTPLARNKVKQEMTMAVPRRS